MISAALLAHRLQVLALQELSSGLGSSCRCSLQPDWHARHMP
jgi:hypothetical protein